LPEFSLRRCSSPSMLEASFWASATQPKSRWSPGC
jgi:hypothetical protein